MAERYFQVLTEGANWRVQDMNSDIALIAARVRIVYQLKLPDAIQLATAIYTDSAALVTHDRDFSKVTDIKILGC